MGRSLKFGYITSYSLAAIKHGISTHYSNPGQSGCFLRSIIGYGCAGKQIFFFYEKKKSDKHLLSASDDSSGDD